jgi:glutamyl-tRNA synthetase/glutamyl-Q tRNA(Asp) synthetase
MTTLPNRLLDSPSLQTVAARWQAMAGRLGAPVTRFAPSPTGELHLGHLLHLRWLWEVAELTGARIVVRMEDHDRSRCKAEHERSILQDLDWLGFTPDPESLASLRGRPPSAYRQSDQPKRYASAFARLREAGLLYGCTCTRGDLGPPDDAGERHYPGTCRGQPVERPGRHVVRVMLPDEPTEVEDLLLGPLHQHPLHDHGDPMIRDALGQWAYQLCVVVDDMAHGVNLIIRGADLVASTGRQFLLARLLGRTMPFATVHHPLLLDSDGMKLSKRDGSTTIRALREAGVTQDEVLVLAGKFRE